MKWKNDIKRALYDRMAEVEQDLSFKKDDILYVDDTLPQGNFGCCMVWQLDENAQKLERGQIPSKYMMEQEFCRRHSMSEAKDENSSAKTSSAAAQRSFFRRKHKHKRSGSKDGKELLAVDTISTDSIPFLDDSVNLAYQRVQKVDCTSPRPVLILGPLLDAVKDTLVKESPGKLCRYLLEVMKASQQAIEWGVKDCLFIDYKRRSGHFDVTTVASVKEITEKIALPVAADQREQKDSVFLRDKVTQKHSKEQFETAQKIEQEYNKYFTGIVQGSPLSIICTQIMTTVDQEQNKLRLTGATSKLQPFQKIQATWTIVDILGQLASISEHFPLCLSSLVKPELSMLVLPGQGSNKPPENQVADDSPSKHGVCSRHFEKEQKLLKTYLWTCLVKKPDLKS
ncbi:disks large homolog 5-like [Podarcis lilfordi]|uniref:Disks large homolog 5-like n=1 Tax=Podarcis lilfordi TaxID=74358 RepID=A0AA35P650_9SAUR|nr:disks large homolog 5-like [Podarcis lilfordi]